MADQRCKNFNWSVRATDDTTLFDGAQLAVLMDIRDELRQLNRVFECHNFLRIPRVLDSIRRNTHKIKRKKK